MPLQINVICTPLLLKLSDVNCFLIKKEDEYFMVDTGFTASRRQVEIELERLGCSPGALKLILITHGDFDHTGNAVYLRQKFGTKIAMHAGDAGMLKNGDMFYQRKFDNRLLRGIMKAFLPFKVENRGIADIFLADGASLAEFGLEACIYNTPGHSTGSICILTAEGDLFAGDLLNNSGNKPMLNTMMYDKDAGNASLERLKTLSIKTVYPGHGKKFSWEELIS
jgi:glyoxylase-like metal-dependent hydrolase (beta-lactamase superfamily II)